MTSTLSSVKWGLQKPPPPRSQSVVKKACKQGLRPKKAGSPGGTLQVPRRRVLLQLNNPSQLWHNPSGSSVGLKDDPGEGKRGDRAGQDLWQKVAGSGSEGAPAWALSHPDPMKSPCWHKQRNYQCSRGPKGTAGLSSERAAAGGGAGCDFSLQIMTHLGNIPVLS